MTVRVLVAALRLLVVLFVIQVVKGCFRLGSVQRLFIIPFVVWAVVTLDSTVGLFVVMVGKPTTLFRLMTLL